MKLFAQVALQLIQNFIEFVLYNILVMVAISKICAKPKSSGTLYNLSLDISGVEINLQNLKRNLKIFVP